MDPQNNPTGIRSQLVTIPGAIIVAGAIIAIAIIWTQRPAQTSTSSSNQPQVPQVNMAPVTAADHILGNPNASIKIVEYSDPSCPYCQMFNPTMEQIMSAYGAGGKVAWVYRQFPLDVPDQNGNVLHPLAGVQAEGLECAASLGGNTAFWNYEKEWFSVFPQDGADEAASLNSQQMAQVAKDVGLNAVAFNDCVSSNQFKDKIDASYTDGINAGVSGTPYTVVVTPSGTKIPLPGAVSYSTLKTTIDTLLTETQ
jgi:protein-disulfide isomerase